MRAFWNLCVPKIRRCWSSGLLVLVDDAGDPVRTACPEGIQVGDRWWQRLEWCGAVQESVRPMLVVMPFIGGEHSAQMATFHIKVRSSSSLRQPPIHRSIIAFIRGI